ncbi:hypothetical protein ACFPC0_13025 [Streptomyces andamanensis]|uniref:Uncharacterized protein n=1 Tax=Streptomyces andamanensis TaxID=1565035 RepID=A0ABV8TDK7_9ACTN
MEGKKDGQPPSEPTQKAEDAKEKRKKGPSWAAGSFVLNLLRLGRDWWNHCE